MNSNSNTAHTAQKRKLGILLGVLALLGGGMTLVAVFPSASNQGYAPDQPIPFSHKLHAGQYKMACTYCHSNAEKSNHATIPPVATCMNCHSIVKTDSPHIQKIKKHYDEGTPIEWVRIHELPDHAHFPHKRHVAKGVSCQTCHGPVEEMDKVYQYAPLNMGWCLNCHKGDTAPKHVLQSTYPDQPHPQGPVASTSCAVCHY